MSSASRMRTNPAVLYRQWWPKTKLIYTLYTYAFSSLRVNESILTNWPFHLQWDGMSTFDDLAYQDVCLDIFSLLICLVVSLVVFSSTQNSFTHMETSQSRDSPWCCRAFRSSTASTCLPTKVCRGRDPNS